MVSVKNEINELLLNCVSDLETRLNESRTILSSIQEKMDSKVSEAKEYKVQVDDAKENIKRLESEIDTLESDLVELKEKYGKKNLVAVIDAGTKEINSEVKKKQDEIQVHKNKIAELTNRAKSIKDLLMNLKKDKKIKEERLKDLENCVSYYKNRLEDVVKFAEEHEDLDDYFVSYEETDTVLSNNNIFEDIAEIDEAEETNVFENVQEEVSIEDADAVFNDVINSEEEIEEENTNEEETNEFDDLEESDETNVDEFENGEDFDLVIDEQLDETILEDVEETNEDIDESEEFNDIILDSNEQLDLSQTTELKIDDLLNAVKEPISMIKEEKENDSLEKLNNINETIDKEFSNIFGQNINEPIKTVDFFGNEYNDEIKEEDIVNKLTNMGLDYYSFRDEDKKLIESNFNEQVISEIVKILKDNKIQLDNLYVDGRILSSIAPAELSIIIDKLVNAGQSADAIGYVLDKLPIVDLNLLNTTITNYGDYIKNISIVDIIFNSLKGDK